MENYMQFSCEWISEGIGDSYKSWTRKDFNKPLKSASRVFIESPTGTGKTTFILDELLPYAAQHDRNILYLGNRAALKEQTQYAAERNLIRSDEYSNSEDLGTAKLFYYPESNTSITILNYQAFVGFSNHYLHNGNPFYYIIFDEAHFFLEDSTFNPMTTMVLERIMQLCSDAVLIFMSATIHESVSTINSVLEIYQDTHPQPEIHQAFYKKDYVYYRNQLKRGNYNVQFFSKESSIVDEISKTPGGEKWLIFVTSKSTASKLQDKIKEQTKSSVRLLSADRKNGRAWHTIVNQSRYKERVLIATQVLDNGVNIIDPHVKHIVLPFCNRVEFMQMLGRKRTDSSENINVYVTVPSIQTVNSQLRRVNEMSTALNEVIELNNKIFEANCGIEFSKVAINGLAAQNETGMLNAKIGELREEQLKCQRAVRICLKKKRELLQAHWLAGKQHINNLFYIDGSGYLCPNIIAYEKLQQLEEFYSDLIAHVKNPNYYQSVVLNWLNDSQTILPLHLDMENLTSLKDLLSSYINKPIPQEKQAAFYGEFQHLYKLHCYAEFKDDQEKLTELLSIRKGKTQRKATMNKSLAMLNLPYEVKKERNCWVVRQKLT